MVAMVKDFLEHYLIALIFLLNTCVCYSNFDFNKINLPKSHLNYYFNKFPQIRQQCLEDNTCPYRQFIESSDFEDCAAVNCWGYETDCVNRFCNPICSKNDSMQIETFYYQADFGYVKQQINEMTMICEPTFEIDSFLECSKYLRFCRAKNIFLNLTNLLHQNEPARYNTEVLKAGEIGGHCNFNESKLKGEIDHMGALQSWAPELRNFVELKRRPIIDDTHEDSICDITLNKPTFILKLDATSNMYHHFCDFFNLYASLHVNQSHSEAFDTDVNIIIWETYNYFSWFSEVFKAFTKNEIHDLKHFKGKKVCFRNLVLPLLPRMIFGLYYNTPIIHSCHKSGLFKAFSEFVLHRLKIPLHINSKEIQHKQIRITFLIRRTKYRQILNYKELLNELNKNKVYSVNVVSFEKGPSFLDQLEIIRNTDIFIGIHGAGLTHLLFLPDWAAVFELYNCEDSTCYKDLARLRGVKYFTWESLDLLHAQNNVESHEHGGAHAKFTNYIFDKDEFMRIVNNAAVIISNEQTYKDFINEKSSITKKDEL